MTSRISQSMLYTSFINYLDQTTTSLHKLYEQGSTQKKINNPSDNPVGMARILSYRDSIKALTQYQANINNSKGWLGLADTTLKQVEDQLTRLKELAVQASTGTLNERDRKSILNEVKQIYDQLLSLANTTYEGRSIFAGHKTDSEAFEKGLTLFSNKKDDTGLDDVNAYVKNITGNSDEVIVIEFSKPGSATARIGIDDDINYIVKKGSSQTTIRTGTLKTGETTLQLGGVQIELKKGYEVVTDETEAGEERTELILAPTAIYQGDNESGNGVEIKKVPSGTYKDYNLAITPEKNGSFENQVLVRIKSADPTVSPVILGDGNSIEYQYSFDGGVTWSDEVIAENPSGSSSIELELPGGKVTLSQLDHSSGASIPQLDGLEFKIGSIDVEQSNTNLYAFAQGEIKNNIVVRIDSVTGTNGFANGDIIEYSYSTDGGITWDSGHKITATGSGYETLPVEGGLLKIAPSTLTQSLSPGDQFVIHPRDASMESEIYQGVDISVTHVGTQIFGGFYKNSSGMEMVFANDEKMNLFVGIGKLIAALELNNQENISETLDYIDGALTQVTKMHVKIGAKLNRLNTTESILTDLQLNQTERKSFIEDVDFVDLLTKISQQQTVYQAILKSASMIMKVSLVNYV